MRLHALAIAVVVVSAVGCGSRPAQDEGVRVESVDPAKEAGEVSGQSVDANAQPAEDGAAAKVTEKPRLLSDTELSDGWIALFDGKTLFGWKAASEADWRVENEAIVVESGEKGLLYTTSQFSDYVLKADFRSAKGTNSGIFLRTAPTPTDPAADCYELNIADADNPFPTASLVKRSKVEGDHHKQDWQSFEVRLEGPQVTVRLDGEEVLKYEDTKPIRRGHIGLQLNQGKVEFRNIKLKPLGLKPMLNGKDLAGWREHENSKSEFTIGESGELIVKGGKGQLETEAEFGDFVLQLECFVHAKHLNSGVFFRCIPGEEMNGYESQIQNGYENGDRRQPMDWGTGAIFRRQKARLVAADDLEWLHKTLVVDGAHMAVWVNGYQVTDFTDERAPDKNPRKGRRLEPGTITIQGHDPGTHFSFRNLRAAGF